MDTVTELYETEKQLTETFARYARLSRELAKQGIPADSSYQTHERQGALIRALPEPDRRFAASLLEDLTGLNAAIRRGTEHPSEPYADLIGKALASSPDMLPADLRIACQGTEGAYSQSAAECLFTRPSIFFCNTFEGVFRAVDQGLCQYGVLPIENSTAGSVSTVYDLMMTYRFSIVQSCRLKINHALLAKPGVRLSDIREVYSHPQALEQCSDLLQSMGVRACPTRNTAVAAQQVAGSERTDVAALASADCARLYGLQILQDAAQNAGNNHTRFICISKEPQILPGADRTAITLTLPHRPGTLFRLLSVVNAFGVSLEKLESRPLPDRDFEFRFYFDLKVPVYDPALPQLLGMMESSCDSFRYLGTYREYV